MLLGHQLGYCTGAPQLWFVSTSVKARANRLCTNGLSGRDCCPPWIFKGYLMNLDIGYSGANYGHPLNSKRNSGNS